MNAKTQRFRIADAVNDSVATAKSPAVRALEAEPEPKVRKQAARVGAKAITIWLPPEIAMQLKLDSVRRGETIQDMVAGWIEAQVKAGQ